MRNTLFNLNKDEFSVIKQIPYHLTSGLCYHVANEGIFLGVDNKKSLISRLSKLDSTSPLSKQITDLFSPLLSTLGGINFNNEFLEGGFFENDSGSPFGDSKSRRVISSFVCGEGNGFPDFFVVIKKKKDRTNKDHRNEIVYGFDFNEKSYKKQFSNFLKEFNSPLVDSNIETDWKIMKESGNGILTFRNFNYKIGQFSKFDFYVDPRTRVESNLDSVFVDHTSYFPNYNTNNSILPRLFPFIFYFNADLKEDEEFVSFWLKEKEVIDLGKSTFKGDNKYTLGDAITLSNVDSKIDFVLDLNKKLKFVNSEILNKRTREINIYGESEDVLGLSREVNQFSIIPFSEEGILTPNLKLSIRYDGSFKDRASKSFFKFGDSITIRDSNFGYEWKFRATIKRKMCCGNEEKPYCVGTRNESWHFLTEEISPIDNGFRFRFDGRFPFKENSKFKLTLPEGKEIECEIFNVQFGTPPTKTTFDVYGDFDVEKNTILKHQRMKMRGGDNSPVVSYQFGIPYECSVIEAFNFIAESFVKLRMDGAYSPFKLIHNESTDSELFFVVNEKTNGGDFSIQFDFSQNTKIENFFVNDVPFKSRFGINNNTVNFINTNSSSKNPFFILEDGIHLGKDPFVVSPIGDFKVLGYELFNMEYHHNNLIIDGDVKEQKLFVVDSDIPMERIINDKFVTISQSRNPILKKYDILGTV